MKSSLNLGQVSGIKVKIHWTFFLLVLWVVAASFISKQNLVTTGWNVLFLVVLFACVVLHELGHALTARRYGYNTRQITLLPIGGVASLEKMPENPRQELFVAIAGPLVNVLIAALIFILIPSEMYVGKSPEILADELKTISGHNFLFYVFYANLMLVLFNMLPAFPMDGGRVLRAVLSMWTDRIRATQIASAIGEVAAVIFFLVGLLYSPILVLIAIFIFFGAQGENIITRQTSLLKGHKVNEAMMTDITLLKPEETLDDVVKIVLAGTERNFVVVDNGTLSGIVFQHDLVRAYKNESGDKKVRDIMTTDIQKVQSSEELTDVYRKIQMTKHNFLPVTENNQVVGAIDLANLDEFMVFKAERISTPVLNRTIRPSIGMRVADKNKLAHTRES